MWEISNVNIERDTNPANVKVLQKIRDAATKRLKELGPCILPKCRTHTENTIDICAHLIACKERMKSNREILNTFNDTLQLMSNNNQEHTIQFLDDLSKANELKAKIEKLETEFQFFMPCRIKGCQKHVTSNEEMETDQPFKPVDKRHMAKRKSSIDNSDLTTSNKFQILEEATPQQEKKFPLYSLKEVPDSIQNPPTSRQRPQHQQQSPESTSPREAHSPITSISEMKELIEAFKEIRKLIQEFPGLLTAAAKLKETKPKEERKLILLKDTANFTLTRTSPISRS
ncbi:hypothetical protein HNY73_011025 [Argiope bruennichi]|uniref:Uncharacterized protein n=1 Tax=Argiope bruennichi TaxID=94029 RepID=A0A8T0F3S9_ARGBR|nr:hypothetical protein HNY73_011025 [Argiope bruennichi]